MGEGATPFPGLLHFTLYLIMLSVKQGSIKCHFFLSLWYDSTWDWNLVSGTISEHYSLDQWPGELFVLDSWIISSIIMCKQMSSGSFKKCHLQNILLKMMYKQNLVLNNPQWLMCHKTQPTKPVMLLFSHLDQYFWGRYELLYLPSDGLNNTTVVL